MPGPDITPLRHFVERTSALVDTLADEAELLAALTPPLRALVSQDNWLPEELAQPHPQFYRQYLLHADAAGRFSVVSFVWGPGQATPVHDHTVWGLVGVLRGVEAAQAYAPDAAGALQANGPLQTLRAGDVAAVSPRIGDVHRVSNALSDAVSISIHVYGANIGTVQRHVFDAQGAVKPFVSGYANAWLPNLWAAA
jgi:predicted metal-dependent enzyme (double-stranded beta helix superfamily)